MPLGRRAYEAWAVGGEAGLRPRATWVSMETGTAVPPTPYRAASDLVLRVPRLNLASIHFARFAHPRLGRVGKGGAPAGSLPEPPARARTGGPFPVAWGHKRASEGAQSLRPGAAGGWSHGEGARRPPPSRSPGSSPGWGGRCRGRGDPPPTCSRARAGAARCRPRASRRWRWPKCAPPRPG